MRVLVLTDGFPPDIVGGLEISAHQICHGLARSGHQLHVLAREGEAFAEDDQPNIRVERIWKQRYRREEFHRFPAKLHGWLEVNARYRNASWNVPLLRKHLASHSYDLCFCFGIEKAGIALATEAARHGLPVLWSAGDYFLFEHQNSQNDSALARLNMATVSRKWIQMALNHPFEFVAYNSENTLRHFAKAGYVADYNWVVHRSCAIPEQIQPYDHSRELTFVIASQIERHKGVHIAIQAASELVQRVPSDWKLQIIGSGNEAYLNELRSMVPTLGLTGRIEFKGKLPHKEATRAMQSCRAVIHPAIWDEPFGRISIEAMANGAPLIASESGAIREIAGDDGALIYPKEDVSALARHMEAVLSDTSLGERLVHTGREIVRARFTPEFELSRYLDILRAIEAKEPLSTTPPPWTRASALEFGQE